MAASAQYPDYQSAGVVPFAFDRQNGMTVFLMSPEEDVQETPVFTDFAAPRDPAHSNAAETAAYGFLDEFTGKQVDPQRHAVEEIADYIDNSPEHSLIFYNEKEKHATYFVEMTIKLQPGKKCMWVPCKEIVENGMKPRFFSTRNNFGLGELNRLLRWADSLDAHLKSGGSSEWNPPVPTAVVEQQAAAKEPEQKKAAPKPPLQPRSIPRQAPRQEPKSEPQPPPPVVPAMPPPQTTSHRWQPPAPVASSQPAFGLPASTSKSATQLLGAPPAFNEFNSTQLLGAPPETNALTPFTGLGGGQAGFGMGTSIGSSFFGNQTGTFSSPSFAGFTGFGQSSAMPSAFDYLSSYQTPAQQPTSNFASAYPSWGGSTGFSTSAPVVGQPQQAQYGSAFTGFPQHQATTSFGAHQQFSSAPISSAGVSGMMGGNGISFGNSFPSNASGYSFPSQGTFTQGFSTGATNGASFGGFSNGWGGNLHF